MTVAQWLAVLTLAAIVCWSLVHWASTRRLRRIKALLAELPPSERIVHFQRVIMDGDELIQVEYGDGHFVYVCGDCGGNCGNCAIVGKLLNLNGVHTKPVMLDAPTRMAIPRLTMGDT